MSRLIPPCAVPLLAVLVIALVAPRAAPAATDSAEATWRGEWRPVEGCASRKTRPLVITVEGEKVIGRIGTAGSFVAAMDGTGRVAGRGVTDGDMAFSVRGRRQGERIGGRFTGFYQDGERQCDGVFEVTLVPPPEPPAAAVAPPPPLPPEPQVVVPEPEPEPEPEPKPAPTVAPTATAAPVIPGTMPRPRIETPRAVDPGDLPDDLDADTRARIERLAELYVQGLITEAEYAAKRRQLLATAATAPPGGGPAAAPSRATAARLQQLDAMRAQGLIGDQEYQVLARRILAETGEVEVAAAPPPPPRPAAGTPEVVFLRLFYNYCMLRVGDLTGIRDLSQQLAWQPLPENYKQAYRPSQSRNFDGWVLGAAAGQSVLVIYEGTLKGVPANVCAMTIRSGPHGDRLAEKIAAHFTSAPFEDRYEGRQRLRHYAITLAEIGDMEVALIHGDDPARPALSLSVVYRRR